MQRYQKIIAPSHANHPLDSLYKWVLESDNEWVHVLGVSVEIELKLNWPRVNFFLIFSNSILNKSVGLVGYSVNIMLNAVLTPC